MEMELKKLPNDGKNTRYYVSNEGKVYSKNVNSDEYYELSTKMSNSGYKMVRLPSVVDGKKRVDYYVHRLVAQAFVDNPNNLGEVDHISGDKLDSRASNLRWTDCKGNHANPISMTRHTLANTENAKKRNIRNGRRKVAVQQWSLDGKELIATYPSITEAARAVGGTHQGIVHCLDGYTKSNGRRIPIYSAYGYKWRRV